MLDRLLSQPERLKALEAENDRLRLELMETKSRLKHLAHRCRTDSVAGALPVLPEVVQAEKLLERLEGKS